MIFSCVRHTKILVNLYINISIAKPICGIKKDKEKCTCLHSKVLTMLWKWQSSIATTKEASSSAASSTH